MNKVLVTGGGGFIGGAIVKRLLAEGMDVTVVGRRTYPELLAMGVRCLQGDIRDLVFLQRAVAGHDTVIHTAAKAGIWGPREEYHSINVAGTENVLQACRRNRVCSLVYTSTPSVVFTGGDLEGADETIPYAAATLCHYPATKILAEQAVLAASSADLKTIAIRPHLVWGPGDPHLIPRLVERGKSGRLKIVGRGENKVDIAYIDNVVHAHLLAAKNLSSSATAAGQAFFIGQSEPVLLWEWINTLFARIGLKPITKKVPFVVSNAAGVVLEKYHGLFLPGTEPMMTRFLAHQLARSHWFSHQKAERLLGYRQLVSTEEGMARLVDWLGERNAGAVAPIGRNN